MSADAVVQRGAPATVRLLPLAFDALVALALTAIDATLLANFWPTMSAGPRSVALVATAALFAALVVRRRAPWALFSVTLVAAVSLAVTGVPLIVIGLVPLVAVYTVPSQRPLREAFTAAALAAAALLLTEALSGFEQDAATVVGNALAIAAAWGIGASAASRQRYVRALEVRTAELEAARDEIARQAVIDERLRIARELHDIVAHAVSVITVRSGVAVHVAESRPSEAAEALVAIEQVSRQTMEDLRRLLGVLRSEDDEQGPVPPRIDDLRALASGAGSGAIAIDVTVDGEAADLDPALQLTVYRIAQEAVTNAIRHGHATHASIRVSRGPDNVRVEVVDDGIGCDGEPDEGHGLRGMRERAAMYGGHVRAANVRGGGFSVDARLPLRGAPA